MRISIFIVVFCFGIGVLLAPVGAAAHTPNVIKTPAQNEIMPLTEPTVSQAIYGNLQGYPHMFEFATAKPIELFTEVLVPDIESAHNNISGIIMKLNVNGSVSEVARLRAKEATWESFYEWWGGDSYRRGSSFRQTIEPGLYRIEVSTPENREKYVLVVGTREVFSLTDYPKLMGEMIKVKQFFEKSSLRIFESPLASVPALFVLTIVGWIWYVRYRRVKAAIPEVQ